MTPAMRISTPRSSVPRPERASCPNILPRVPHDNSVFGAATTPAASCTAPAATTVASSAATAAAARRTAPPTTTAALARRWSPRPTRHNGLVRGPDRPVLPARVSSVAIAVRCGRRPPRSWPVTLVKRVPLRSPGALPRPCTTSRSSFASRRGLLVPPVTHKRRRGAGSADAGASGAAASDGDSPRQLSQTRACRTRAWHGRGGHERTAVGLGLSWLWEHEPGRLSTLF